MKATDLEWARKYNHIFDLDRVVTIAYLALIQLKDINRTPQTTAKIGASSLDIKQTATFEVSKDIVTIMVQNALTPLIIINDMKSK